MIPTSLRRTLACETLGEEPEPQGVVTGRMLSVKSRLGPQLQAEFGATQAEQQRDRQHPMFPALFVRYPHMFTVLSQVFVFLFAAPATRR